MDCSTTTDIFISQPYFANSGSQLIQNAGCAAFQGLSTYSAGAMASSPHGFINALMGLPLPKVMARLAASEFPNLAAVDAIYDGLAESDAAGTAPWP